MLHNTRGIVFHISRYADTSAIVKIYTERFGLMSFIVKGLYSRKSNLRAAHFGHLALLDLVVDHRENKSLHFIRELNLHHTSDEFNDDMSRNAVLLFINELVYKCIREEEPNLPLFAFLQNVIEILRTRHLPLQAFHLLFMLKLTRFLGFMPRISKTTANEFFDMEEGLFLDSEPLHRYFISGAPAMALEQLQLMNFDDLSGFSIKRKVRDELLLSLFDYYKLHMPEMGELKSLKVLQEVLG